MGIRKMISSPHCSRREFLSQTGAAITLGSALYLTGKSFAAGSQGPNERIGIGLIGAGGRGNSHLDMLQWMKEQGDNIEIAAVCDIYKPRLERTAQKYGAKAYSSHHELLADKNVDMVCIATPDHLHGVQAIDAIRAGKDVYCEKPVTHWRQFDTTKELARVVAAGDRAFQLGTQAMSDPVWRQMKKLVQDGLIGQPLYAETGFFRIGDWGEKDMPVDDPNARPGPDLNWEAFLGDSPVRDFSVDRFFRWRLFMDYAGGPVTDLYPHCLTQVVDIMGVGFPQAVTALGGIQRYDSPLREVPDTFSLVAQYSEKAVITVMGTQGNDYNSGDTRGSGQRCPVIRGWDGSLVIRSNKEIEFIPIRIKGAKTPQRFAIEGIEDNVTHWRNLIQCSRSRSKQTFSPMELALRTQTVLHMAMQAFLTQKTIGFDVQTLNMKV
ncbi:MAG: Gfo/Idh/MocA family oxidoreductase [Planctomycetales bacterium]|nr:Gfo/Idh/MocA family oxidoreductase [Planctomycetales bacterium]